MILSICIATYNRANYIGETLESIIPQLDDDLEILIVDGASTDNTQDIVNQYVTKDSRIRYVRLPQKGGVDKDYDTAANLAYGDYCWLFTDDDIIKPGAIDIVKRCIKEKHDLIIINAEVRNRDLSEILSKQQISLKDNKVYDPKNLEELFIDSLPYLTFIGGVIIRRQLWLSRERKSFFGTEFIHLGVIFQKPLIGSAIIIAKPYIVIRYGNAQWISRYFELWMFNWPNFIWSFNSISDNAKSKICKRHPWLNLKKLIWNRSVGHYNKEVYNKYFSSRKVNTIWKICAWLIARFPRKTLVWLHCIYSVIIGAETRANFKNDFSKSDR